MRYEILALRLVLAYLQDDDEETIFLAWAIMADAGLNADQFQVAARTAREAASWWTELGAAEQGRRRILAKLDRLTAVAS